VALAHDFQTKSIPLSEILNVIQDFWAEELPQKNTKDTKEFGEKLHPILFVFFAFFRGNRF